MWTSNSWFGLKRTEVFESSNDGLLEVADPHKHAKDLSGRPEMKDQTFNVIKSGGKHYITLYPHRDTVASYMNGKKIEPDA